METTLVISQGRKAKLKELGYSEINTRSKTTRHKPKSQHQIAFIHDNGHYRIIAQNARYTGADYTKTMPTPKCLIFNLTKVHSAASAKILREHIDPLGVHDLSELVRKIVKAGAVLVTQFASV